MQIAFLGTNGWYDTSTGYTPCILIDTKKAYVILDAGNGFSRLDEYLKREKPIYLFLTHLHIDHISGLHILSKYKKNFKKGLKIFVPEKVQQSLKVFINLPYTVPLKDLPFKSEIIGLAEGKHNDLFTFSCLNLDHVGGNYGYRMELEGKIVVYSGDTGKCQNLVQLAKDADILINECSLPAGKKTKWGHTNPEITAQIAKDAGVKQLIMTHFAAHKYGSLESRNKALKIAQKFFTETLLAKDGLVINL